MQVINRAIKMEPKIKRDMWEIVKKEASGEGSGNKGEYTEEFEKKFY